MEFTLEDKINQFSTALYFIESGVCIGICAALDNNYLMPELDKFRPINRNSGDYWFEYGTLVGRRKRIIILKEILRDLRCQQLFNKMRK